MATATAENNVEAKPRQTGGKNDARRLRKNGLIPGVLYGAGQEPFHDVLLGGNAVFLAAAPALGITGAGVARDAAMRGPRHQ